MSRYVTKLEAPNLVDAELDHNGDWSGQVFVRWTDHSGTHHQVAFPAEIIPAFLLTAIGTVWYAPPKHEAASTAVQEWAKTRTA